jgi:hypothetical protein
VGNGERLGSVEVDVPRHDPVKDVENNTGILGFVKASALRKTCDLRGINYSASISCYRKELKLTPGTKVS